MTKLEAWHAWSVIAHAERLSSQFTLDNSSHGKAFSFAWDAAVKAEREACAKVCEEWFTPNLGREATAAIAAAIRSRT